jgi:hypothetical protein
MAAAESALELSQPLGKDGTVRDILVQREKATGQRETKLDEGRIPPACLELWNVFLDLHSKRRAAFFGVSPLCFEDIESYQRLMGITLTPWEVETILALDSKVVSRLNERLSRKD